ncbi:hypothetical protein ONE63_010359 [Megalurothrips usitatus]|uniref:Partial AB-hydrolase lipase domain-containing protein n=1 Tax=Megalurothrips usitatus TaxID=439358 RepID=A0AAV7XLQ7_9NEOP|nr:hypothetical protein ONE63_010359 [Megalurothrips usitatus]
MSAMWSVCALLVVLASASASPRVAAPMPPLHNLLDSFASWEAALENGVDVQEKLLDSGTPVLPPIDNTRHYFGTAAVVTEHGYPVEEYKVNTTDGYVITIFRIPPSQACLQPNKTVRAVFIMHGLLSSSTDWCAPPANRAIPYLLSNCCYDVWLGNARGTTESRDAGKYSPDDGRYWDFTWHEIGVYDVPASIDFILNFTKQPNLHYVGHSQGSLVYFVMASEVPGSMDKIRSAHLLAPSVYMKCIKSAALRLGSIELTPVWRVAQLLNNRALLEILPHSLPLVLFGDTFCSYRTPITQQACFLLIDLIGGSNPKQRDTARLSDYMANFPGGSALKQLAHFGQLIHASSEVFRKFDYGSVENMKRYNATVPPEYNVSRAGTSNLTLVYGLNDFLAVQSNVDKLHRLNPSSKVVVVPDAMWNHFDFIIGLGVKENVNDDVIARIKDFDARNP